MACFSNRTSPAWRLALLFALQILNSLAHADPPRIELRLLADGLSMPLEIVNAGDRSGRLFVVEKGGAIRVIEDGKVKASPFLDIAELISAKADGGLLGLAFDPDYRDTRRFFVFYSRAADRALTLASYRVPKSRSDAADPSTAQVLATFPHPGYAHYGGRIAFGPDGYLYIGVGDGGSAYGISNASQNLDTHLGKLLRVDVLSAPGRVVVPRRNPFAGKRGTTGLIWAYGLRNPWKFSFDRKTGDLYIADVGQDAAEEVNFQPADARGGQNYGWRAFEGMSCFVPSAGCALPDHTPPVFVYGHAQGDRSITGGYVYRGEARQLRGAYVYGDFRSNRIWALKRKHGRWENALLLDTPAGLSGLASFGEDEAGELFVASLVNGRIYALDVRSGDDDDDEEDDDVRGSHRGG